MVILRLAIGKRLATENLVNFLMLFEEVGLNLY